MCSYSCLGHGIALEQDLYFWFLHNTNLSARLKLNSSFSKEGHNKLG